MPKQRIALVRSRLQVIERADGSLARSPGRQHHLDEDIIGIGLDLVGARRAADVHGHYAYKNIPPRQYGIPDS